MGFSPKGKSKGPELLGSLLKSFFEGKLPKNLGDESRIFAEWPRAVGGDVSRQAAPTSFRNGILFVETHHPIWTAELTARRHIILRKLNEALGGSIVREIQFRQSRH